VCRAGGRSVQATNILQQAGFKDVANLTGGMLRWRAEGPPGRRRQRLAPIRTAGVPPASPTLASVPSH
jgi:hypothetical protein